MDERAQTLVTAAYFGGLLIIALGSGGVIWLCRRAYQHWGWGTIAADFNAETITSMVSWIMSFTGWYVLIRHQDVQAGTSLLLLAQWTKIISLFFKGRAFHRVRHWRIWQPPDALNGGGS